MNTEISKNKPGDTLDSWCGKCKLMLGHTIEAMVGNKPARVHCNTCQSQHTYKPNPPGTTRKAGQRGATQRSESPAPRMRASRYQTALKDKDMAAAKNYSAKDRYEMGDLLQHPTFGFGVTTTVKDGTKIEVLFESGSKTLVHGR